MVKSGKTFNRIMALIINLMYRDDQRILRNLKDNLRGREREIEASLLFDAIVRLLDKHYPRVNVALCRIITRMRAMHLK